MSYLHLITTADIRRVAPSMFRDAGEDATNALTGGIASATALIESYLGQKLIVRSYTGTVKADRWDYNAGTELYEAMMHYYPVVQIDTAGLTVDTTAQSVITATEAQSVQTVTYFAGWKRADQALADLSAVTGLTTTPNDLPADIVRCCARIAIFEAQQGLDATVGQGRRVTTGYGGEQVADSADTGFIDRELKQISMYQRVAFYV